MKSMNQKTFRADTEEKNERKRRMKRKQVSVCIAVALIGVLLLAGFGQWAWKSYRSEKDPAYAQMEENVRKQMQEEMQGASAYLEKLDGSLAKNSETLLEVETTQKKLTENASGMTETVTELDKRTETQIRQLQERVDQVRSEIAETLTKISETIQAMQETDSVHRLDQSVQEIRQKIGELEGGLNQAYVSLQDLIRSLQKEEGDKNQELLSRLTGVETDLKRILEKEMAQFLESFSDLSNNFRLQVVEWNGRMDQLDSGLNGLQNSMGSLTKTLQNDFTLQQQTLFEYLENAALHTDTGREELKAYLDQLKTELQQDLNQVFTSVSNGKKRLASALLTKGVAAEDDATFAELMDAILRIEQKIVIGVEQIPGHIVYEYHYHVDGNGETPHTQQSESQGGCYTLPCRHVHSDAEGCYSMQRYHAHSDDCPHHPEWVDWAGVEPYWGRIYDCGDLPLNATRKVLCCTKSTGDIIGYAVSCGFADGQIVGATISYDEDAQRAKAANLFPESKEETAMQEEETDPAAFDSGDLPPEETDEPLPENPAEPEPLPEPSKTPDLQEPTETSEKPEEPEETETQSEPADLEETPESESQRETQ